MVLLGALLGSLPGVILGFLNGIVIAAVIAAGDTSLTQHRSRAVLVTCVLLSLIGTGGFLYLLFATDLFTNFSGPGTPSKPNGRTRMIVLLLDPGTTAMFIAAPALVAAAVAYWASNQVMRWYMAPASVPLKGGEPRSDPASLDNLWPL